MHSTSKLRNYKTFCMCLAFVIVGQNQMMTGPTLVHMELLFHTSTQGMSMAFVAENLGGLIGAILPAFYFDHYDPEYQFSNSYLYMGIITCVAPWMPGLWLYILMLFGKTVAIRYATTSAKPYILRLWSDSQYKNMVFQFIDVAWSLGAFTGPLLVIPFLSDLPMIKTGTGNDREVNKSQVDYNDIKNVRYPFLIMGCLAFINAAMFYSIKNTTPLHANQHKLNSKESQETLLNNTETIQNSKSTNICTLEKFGFRNFHKVLTGATFMYTVFIVWQGSIMSTFISVFVIKGLGWSADTGALMVSLFRGSQMVARFIGVFVSHYMSPGKMLSINMMIGITAYSLMYSTSTIYPSTSLMYFSIILAGFAVSNSFPTAILWGAQYLEVKASYGTLFGAAAAIGSMSCASVLGYLFENYSKMCFVYTLLFACMFNICLFIAMNILVSSYSKFNTKQNKFSNVIST